MWSNFPLKLITAKFQLKSLIFKTFTNLFHVNHSECLVLQKYITAYKNYFLIGRSIPKEFNETILSRCLIYNWSICLHYPFIFSYSAEDHYSYVYSHVIDFTRTDKVPFCFLPKKYQRFNRWLKEYKH